MNKTKHQFIPHRDPCNLPKISPGLSNYSVWTHQVFQILDFYNGGIVGLTKIFRNLCLLDSST